MIHTLPGGVLEVGIRSAEDVRVLLDSLFTTGGLVLSQISNLTGLEAYMVQNWIKRGFLAPPVRKKYGRDQLCRILLLNQFRSSIQLERICALLSYVNGDLTDASDDLISDSQLYLYVVSIAVYVDSHRSPDLQTLKSAAEAAAADYVEPYPGAKRRVLRVLEVFAAAICAAHFIGVANDLSADLDLGGA